MNNKQKYMPVIIAAVLIICVSLMTGCGFLKKSDGGIQTTATDNASKPQSTRKGDTEKDERDDPDDGRDVRDGSESENEQNSTEGNDTAEKGWPKRELPGEIPEYKKGSVVSAGGDKNSYTILVETNRDELKEYLDQLEDSGWQVDRDYRFPYAKKNNIQLDFMFNSDTLMVITVKSQEAGSWPADDEIPPDIIQPDKGMLVGEVVISDLGEREGEIINITFDYEGLSAEYVDEYLQKYIDMGWEDYEYMVSKVIEWNDRRYKATMEVMEYQGTLMFTVNLREQL